MPLQKYSDFLEINPLFESVVDIGADQRNANLWREYIVGDDMENLVEHLCASLGNEAPDMRRSFWLHGSYGTGKSYAAIFVKHLMEEKPEVVDKYLSASSRLSAFRNRFLRCRRNGDYLVIWKTGCTGIRTGDMMLLEAEKAIQDALIAKYGDKAYLGSGSLIDAVKARLADPSINWEHMLETTTLGDDYGSMQVLRREVEAGNLTALQATAAVIRQRGFGLINNLETFKAWVSEVIDENGLSQSGIFFIWDEFTEYVSHSDDHTVMQQISEFCKEKPFFMLYVVHRSEEMTNSMGKDRYQLITNRFHQVEFHISADAAFDLIASSINTRNGMEHNWAEERKAVIRGIKPSLPDMAGLDDKVSERIEHLCPIHPMTVKLLSRVAESFAAAQRTMFRFMKDRSNADIGFVGYIHRYGPSDQACWLTPEWLWDYFFTRESDFRDKDTQAADFIHHYEESRRLVESDENAHRVFRVAMLLMAVMSSAKGAYGGKRAQGGLSATVECLETCLAGVMTRTQVGDLLDTMEECKILLRDQAANGAMRLQLPFKGGTGDDFRLHLEANDRKYTRYQMFSKDGSFAQAFEKQAWDENDASLRRMKIAVCCAETLSVKARLDEIQKELDRAPYSLGLLIVTVRDDAQYISVQNDLRSRACQSEQPRLTIALVKMPLTDEKRAHWLKSITKMEMANLSGQTGSANQHKQEAAQVVNTWVAEAVSGSKIIAWNGEKEFTNQYGMANLRKTIQTYVLKELFPYAPETVMITSTAYKNCNDAAPLAGIRREGTTSQTKSVLNSLSAAGLMNLTSIDEMAAANGSPAAKAVGALAKAIRAEMTSGQRVMLGEFWMKLQREPFGYFDTIICGVLLGFVFAPYMDSAFSWTDSVQSTHVLGETTLKTMVLTLCKARMTTDYLSEGSATYQSFRDYIKSIFGLADAQVANETECWHNAREAVTRVGAPFWTLKYLPNETYGSVDFRHIAMEIIDGIQSFIAQDTEREGVMSQVNQHFVGRGKLRETLRNAFRDKNVMASAFRSFLFAASPALSEIVTRLGVQPEALRDKLHFVMQGAIYTWTEAQVREKLADVTSEYEYLDALNKALGKAYHSAEDARQDLANLFRHTRISIAAVEKLNKPWYPALKLLYGIARNDIAHKTLSQRQAEAAVLTQHGKAAKEFLSDGKPVLGDILDAANVECTKEELDTVYVGLRDMTCDASCAQFEKELASQISFISHARNRILLLERWRSLTGTETVKAWCAVHRAPLKWIVDRDCQKAISTLMDVQANQRTVDQSVQEALAALERMDAALLTDDARIEAAFLKTVGEEYAAILKAERDKVLAQVKMKIGNDMSAWTTSDLAVLQRVLKQLLQDKAKKEKFENTKTTVHRMKEKVLRDRVVAFLEEHPEFCDSFTE